MTMINGWYAEVWQGLRWHYMNAKNKKWNRKSNYVRRLRIQMHGFYVARKYRSPWTRHVNKIPRSWLWFLLWWHHVAGVLDYLYVVKLQHRKPKFILPKNTILACFSFKLAKDEGRRVLKLPMDCIYQLQDTKKNNDLNAPELSLQSLFPSQMPCHQQKHGNNARIML